ncbi:DUF3331 domain-containing protein [Burkholderia gladioli]|uniref:DUF3331 domain-containing protein n=1 Tax=Burkholderia gladioli TaxID=28095 RepID=UPI00164040F9|nr:DUF3331 domain-containing protein [Burkholderia gladioli]
MKQNALDTVDRARLIIVRVARDHIVVRCVAVDRRHTNEQRWLVSSADRFGHCAASGIPIRSGEAVYRPSEVLTSFKGDPMISVRAIYMPY